MVESQPSKLLVAGSIPVSRSSFHWRRSLARCAWTSVRGSAQNISQAGVAQLVEHLICNQMVGGSIPSASSTNQVVRTGHRVSTPAESEAILWAPNRGHIRDVSTACLRH